MAKPRDARNEGARGHLRVSRFARRTTEKRETGPISHARGQLRVSSFVRRTTEKRETARSNNMLFRPRCLQRVDYKRSEA